MSTKLALSLAVAVAFLCGGCRDEYVLRASWPVPATEAQVVLVLFENASERSFEYGRLVVRAFDADGRLVAEEGEKATRWGRLRPAAEVALPVTAVRIEARLEPQPVQSSQALSYRGDNEPYHGVYVADLVDLRSAGTVDLPLVRRF